MASVKVKFRPSTVNGKEGTLYYQVIHNRVVRQINTEYKLFVSEWDSHSETVVLHHLLTGQERNNYLLSIGSRIKWDKDRLNKIIHALSQSGTFVTDDIVMRFHDNRQELSFNAYISQLIARLKRLGKIRTSEKILPALNNLGTAFAHIIPSFHPIDLLVGVAVGVAMKFIMKMRAANKKKFRQGTEYGSAVWSA